MSNYNSPDEFAKDRLKEFILLELDGVMTFVCPIGEGDLTIKRMRVRLARLKAKARKLNRVPRSFKMIVQSVKAIPEEQNGYERVTLKKEETAITRVLEMIDDVDMKFPGIAGNRRF